MSNDSKPGKLLIILLVVAIIVAVGAWGLVFKLYKSNQATLTETRSREDEKKKIDNPEKGKRAQAGLSGTEESPKESIYDFEFSNVSFKTELGITEVIGEITNNTPTTRSVTFSINIYDDNGNLLATTPGIAGDVPGRGMKVFSAMFIDALPEEFKYTIQINTVL